MRGCTTENCTVALTGICVRGRDAETCPDRDLAESPETIAPTQTPPSSPDAGDFSKLSDLHSAPDKAQLYPGLELGLEDARRLDARDRCHLIGILGAPDSGKTAALVSLYLLLARGRLKTYRFGNSRSIMAFEQLARGSRRWEEGKIPAQLTGHTKLEDPRSPGFLHLRLRRQSDESKVDLLLPDLPGEWTDELIENEEYERLQFLQSARVIWLMIDGIILADPDRRKDPIGRAKILLARLAKFIPLNIPLVLVVSRQDRAGVIPKGTLDGVLQKALEVGFGTPAIMEIASFSEEPESVPPGSGIESLLGLSIVDEELPPEEVRARPVSGDGRNMLKHRRTHA